ncbi:prepilin-type N-terminal cleavage/methylation domain-containing protein [Candidatus Saccharibacteria bacterium CPR2]|nr:prepilin-type N-terminal cleavage/methylation domain-containing protein [Candidatus Saccharibacteria bacterium CPR2]
MFTKLKKSQEGFTIVELLIVIVVIGILAALVLTTFQGVQARARDTERKTDVNALHTHLEVYYNDNGRYPTLAQVTTANLPGLDPEALNDPNGNALSANAPFAYVPAPTNCDNTNNDCTSYTLTATMEEEANYVKGSLN